MGATAAGSRTLGRGLEVLQAVGESAEGVTVADVCQATGLDRAVVHRLLGTLDAMEMVARDPDTRRYRLGVRMVEMGGRAAAQIPVRRIAKPALRMLQDGTRETACLTVPLGRDSVVVDRLGPTEIAGRTLLPLGARTPLWRSAHGRALLAFASEEQRGGLSSAVPQLDAELATLRERGFATGEDELHHGVGEVAAPLLGDDGTAVASLVVLAPTDRVPNPAGLGARVRSIAREVSRRLGNGNGD